MVAHKLRARAHGRSCCCAACASARARPLCTKSRRTRAADGRTALHEAAVWGVRAVVEGVLRYTQGWELPWGSGGGRAARGRPVQLIDRDLRTPLTLAARHGHVDVVALLASRSRSRLPPARAELPAQATRPPTS